MHNKRSRVGQATAAFGLWLNATSLTATACRSLRTLGALKN